MSTKISKSELLSLNPEKQLEFVKLWCEANETEVDDEIADATPLLVIYTGINELYDNALKNFSEYFKYESILKQGHVSSERYAELIDGAPFSEEEKLNLFEVLKSEMLGSFEVEELQRFFVDINGETYSATFMVSEHPSNYHQRFFGLFENDSLAVKSAEKVDFSEEPFWL